MVASSGCTGDADIFGVSVQEKISRGVTVAILRRRGVDVASMTEEQVDALVRERKAERQAEAAAKQARRAQKQQVKPLPPHITLIVTGLVTARGFAVTPDYKDASARECLQLAI